MLQRALLIRESVLGPDHPDTAISLNNLALLYYATNAYEKAMLFLQRAVEIMEDGLGAAHPTTQEVGENYELMQQLVEDEVDG